MLKDYLLKAKKTLDIGSGHFILQFYFKKFYVFFLGSGYLTLAFAKMMA